MKRQTKKCNISGLRERRGVSDGDGITGDAIRDFWVIFWDHANFIREALVENPQFGCFEN